MSFLDAHVALWPCSQALVRDCRNGDVSAVRKWLSDKKARPNAFDSASLRRAVQRGHVEVVRLLLADSRPERALPSANDSEALRDAASDGHLEMVRLLLADTRPGRVLPNAMDSFALRIAARLGHAEMVRLLLADRRIEHALPNANHSAIVRLALSSGYWKMREQFSTDAILPSGRIHRGWRGYVEVVRLLLRDQNPERAFSNPLDWVNLVLDTLVVDVQFPCFRAIEMIFARFAPLWQQLQSPASYPTPPDVRKFSQFVDALSPTALRSMGVDWLLRQPLPSDNVWRHTQQRLLRWAELAVELDQSKDLARQLLLLSRLEPDHDHWQPVDWQHELIVWLREWKKRRLLLQTLLPSLLRRASGGMEMAEG